MKACSVIFLLFLSWAGTGTCTEYFPMHEGDVWYLSSMPEMYVGGTEALNGQVYWTVYSRPENYRLYRTDDAGIVYIIGEDGEETIIYKFHADTDDTWMYDSRGMQYEVTLRSVDDIIETPAGTFEHCYGFHFRATNAFDADYMNWFAPEVGLVKHASTSWGTYRLLQKARVGDGKYPDHALPLRVTDSTPRPGQRDVQADITIAIYVNYGIPSEVIAPGLIKVFSRESGYVSGTISQDWGYDNAIIRFLPDSPLSFNDMLTVTLTSAIQDYCGDTLEHEYSYTFATRPQFYDPPPFTLGAPLELNSIVPREFALGDYDNDGDSDMVVSGYRNNDHGNPEVQLFLNNGGVFFAVNASLAALRYLAGRGAMHWIDYNNDGWIDLTYGGTNIDYDEVIYFYKNNNGTFEQDTSQTLAGMYNMSLQWCDYDLDGYPDLALAGPQQIIVLYHNENGVLRETDRLFFPYDHSQLSGSPPVFSWIGAGEMFPATLVVFNDDETVAYAIQHGQFQSSGVFRSDDYAPVDASCSLDGIPVHEWSECVVGSTIFVTHRGRLIFKADMGEIIDPAAVFLQDIDHDGDLDMFVGGEKRVGSGDCFMFVQAYTNNGGSYFLTTTYNFETDLNIRENWWTDIDSDGDRDLVLSCYEKIIVLRNDGLTGTGISSSAMPAPVSLSAYPNPFNGSVAISYTLETDAPVECAIYSLAGQKVHAFDEAPHLPGRHALYWSATDSGGRRVASGVYLVRLRQGDALRSTRITLVK